MVLYLIPNYIKAGGPYYSSGPPSIRQDYTRYKIPQYPWDCFGQPPILRTLEDFEMQRFIFMALFCFSVAGVVQDTPFILSSVSML